MNNRVGSGKKDFIDIGGKKKLLEDLELLLVITKVMMGQLILVDLPFFFFPTTRCIYALFFF